MKKLLFLILLISALVFSGEYDRDDWPHWKDLDGDCQNAGMETEEHQGMNVAIHAVWMEAGLDLVPKMVKNS